MKAMLGISLCSYLYLNYQKCFVFLIIAYVFSATKLEKRAEKVLSGSKVSVGRRERGRGQEGEMALTMYAHKNK
jgi:hypothetical protein